MVRLDATKVPNIRRSLAAFAGVHAAAIGLFAYRMRTVQSFAVAIFGKD